MPICDGCEQKVPYQELDTHQRFCLGSEDGEAPTTADRIGIREAVFEECLELAKARLAERESKGALPNDPAGIEGSNIRFTRSANKR